MISMKRLGVKYGVKVQFDYMKSDLADHWSCLVSSREKVKIRINRNTRRCYLRRWFRCDDNLKEIAAPYHGSIRPAGQRYFKADFDHLLIFAHNNKYRFYLDENDTNGHMIVRRGPKGEWTMDWDHYKKMFQKMFSENDFYEKVRGTRLSFDRAIDRGSVAGKCNLNVMY